MYNKPKPAASSSSNQLLPRIAGLYLGIILLSLLLGAGFFFLLFSLVSVALWFADDWEPAYYMMLALLRLHPKSGGFYPRRRNLWRITLIVIKACVILYCLYLGFSILSRGFLEQNMIYLLMRN
jgi:hypothetical protein